LNPTDALLIISVLTGAPGEVRFERVPTILCEAVAETTKAMTGADARCVPGRDPLLLSYCTSITLNLKYAENPEYIAQMQKDQATYCK
jgi:hypothetical protein